MKPDNIQVEYWRRHAGVPHTDMSIAEGLDFARGKKQWSFDPHERAQNYVIEAVTALTLASLLTDENVGNQ